MNNSYTVDLKLTLVLEYLEGQSGRDRLSLADVANKHGISRGLLHKWVKTYQEQGVTGLKSRRGKATGPGQGRPKKNLTENEKRIYELEAEVALLKKSIELRGR